MAATDEAMTDLQVLQDTLKAEHKDESIGRTTYTSDLEMEFSDTRVKIAESAADDLAGHFHGPGKCIDAQQHSRIVHEAAATAEAIVASQL